jgi:hypothetical protein
MVTRLYKNRVAVFSMLRGFAEEIKESRMPKLAAIGVQKSKRSTTEITRMRIERVVSCR